MAQAWSVIVSGCYSGPNPSPGLGIARSLRRAFPDARLIGRDFSAAATGLHADVFDDNWVCPPWEDADLEVSRAQLLPRLENPWMVSGLDLEVRWLSPLNHPRILVPPLAALRGTVKPEMSAAIALPVRVPAWIPLSAGEREVLRFCRGHGWQVWVKGPAYEALRVSSWTDLCVRARELETTWGTRDLFIQAHVTGQEVSVAYAAHEGEFLGAVLLEKCLVTEQGKVWGGNVTAVPDDLATALEVLIRELRWTGGGELEFIRGVSGGLWLFDWNPRFPAWIHGATLAGENLPAALLQRAAGWEPAQDHRPSPSFVRVVTEVPARCVVPAAVPGIRKGVLAGKHPSGMPQLMRRLPRSSPAESGAVASLPADLAADLTEVAAGLGETPARRLLPRTANARFALASQLQDAGAIRVAYSIKTNPDASLMDLAWRHGLMAEAISEQEVDWALACGWPTSDIVYNGPVPLVRPPGSGAPLGVVVADDVDTFRGYLHSDVARVVGLRLCPPLTQSRFGVCLDDPAEFTSAVAAMAATASTQLLGVGFHVPSSEIGPDRWRQLAESVVDFAHELSQLSCHRLSVIDLGGGWTPEDFETAASHTVPQLAAAIRRRLGDQVHVLIEPGKALVESAMAVFSRVMHIRKRHGGVRDAILDAGISDVPLVGTFPHRMAIVRGGRVAVLGLGSDQLLGPSCRENDRIAEDVSLPEDLRVGDVIAICDAGAYDASMAHVFGRGGGMWVGGATIGGREGSPS